MGIPVTKAQLKALGYKGDMSLKQEPSPLETAFEQLWKVAGNEQEPVKHYHFIEGRKYEADFAWPEQKLIVELDGQKAHVNKRGKQRDSERDRLTVLAGWRVLRFTGDDLRKRPIQCVEEVMAALGQKVNP